MNIAIFRTLSKRFHVKAIKVTGIHLVKAHDHFSLSTLLHPTEVNSKLLAFLFGTYRILCTVYGYRELNTPRSNTG